MKNLFTFLFILFFSFFNSQVKNVGIVDFFHWTADDGIYYEFILISENITELNSKKPVTIRVKYSLNGGISKKLVEYYATMRWVQDPKNSENLIAYIEADKTAKIIEGTNGYTPDNFTFYYKKGGDLLTGYQADHNEMANSEVNYAKVFKTNYSTVDDLRSLVRLYFKSDEPLYRDLMTYASKYD